MFALGVRASERMAEIDMPYLVRYQPVIYTVGQKYCMDPAVIAGVVSRESPSGNVINMGNVGDGIRVVQVTRHKPGHAAAALHGPSPRGCLHICCVDGKPGTQPHRTE